MFGLSDEPAILHNPRCNGTEYYLSNCVGYELRKVEDLYCLSGNYQAGVLCIEGIQCFPYVHQYRGLCSIY